MFATLCQAQSSRQYRNAQLFKGEAIVFSDQYKLPFKHRSDMEAFYTPNDMDIIRAEDILISRCNLDIPGICNKPLKIKKKYWKYNRQYLGYVDKSGNRLIIINLLNFKRKKWANKYYEGWQDAFFVGFGPFYEKNTSIVIANLDTNRLELF